MFSEQYLCQSANSFANPLLGKTTLIIAAGQVVTQNNNCNIMLSKNVQKKIQIQI